MKITYKQNPLETIVELDDQDRKKFKLTEDEEETLDDLILGYEKDLKSSHCGDCTCFPASCDKCYAESMLGIDTISELGKHEGYAISEVFRKEEINTCSEAIYYMEMNQVKAEEIWHEPHVKRWNMESKNAVKWLKNYQKRIEK